MEKEKYDLILLDLMLPAISGEEIIEKISDTPIIILSAKISSEDKVNCLLSGANDYITKPFDGKELLARIEVQLRPKNKDNNLKTLKYKELELLNDNHTLPISNAIKYSEEDFRVKLKSNGIIEFSNKTNLLDSTSLKKIFDRYYTVKNVKKSNGIGLSIAKQLVDLMGGNINAKYKNNYFIIEIKFSD